MDKMELKCLACDEGHYVEISINDDRDGVLHCDNCGHKVARHSIDIEQICRSLYPPTLEFKVNEDDFCLAMSKLMYRVISCAHQGDTTKEIVNNRDLIEKVKWVWSEVFNEDPDQKTIDFILYRGYFETIDD